VVVGDVHTGLPPRIAGFWSVIDAISMGEEEAAALQQRVAATALPKSRRVGSAFMGESPVGDLWFSSIHSILTQSQQLCSEMVVSFLRSAFVLCRGDATKEL
jgi:hypothetical protein